MNSPHRFLAVCVAAAFAGASLLMGVSTDSANAQLNPDYQVSCTIVFSGSARTHDAVYVVVAATADERMDSYAICEGMAEGHTVAITPGQFDPSEIGCIIPSGVDGLDAEVWYSYADDQARFVRNGLVADSVCRAFGTKASA